MMSVVDHTVIERDFVITMPTSEIRAIHSRQIGKAF
jgi:hypothetical protein